MKNTLLIFTAIFSFLLILLSGPVYADSLVFFNYVSPDDPEATMAWANSNIDVTTYTIFEDSSGRADNRYWDPGIFDREYAVINFSGHDNHDSTYLFRDNGIPIIGDNILQIIYSAWDVMTNLPSGRGAGISHVDIHDVSPVPEPTTMLLFGSGLIGLAGFGKRFLKN